MEDLLSDKNKNTIKQYTTTIKILLLYKHEEFYKFGMFVLKHCLLVKRNFLHSLAIFLMF